MESQLHSCSLYHLLSYRSCRHKHVDLDDRAIYDLLVDEGCLSALLGAIGPSQRRFRKEFLSLKRVDSKCPLPKLAWKLVFPCYTQQEPHQNEMCRCRLRTFIAVGVDRRRLLFAGRSASSIGEGRNGRHRCPECKFSDPTAAVRERRVLLIWKGI